MHDYATTKAKTVGHKIAQTYQSYILQYNHPIMNKVIYNPPLSAKNQTFPFIYYVCKWKVIAKKDDLPGFFNTLITTKIE